jgi:hypothetical protein
MQPRDCDDGKRRLNFRRRDQRVSRQPFGFRLDLCRGVALRIPPLTPCSIAPLHYPRHKSRPKQ